MHLPILGDVTKDFYVEDLQVETVPEKSSASVYCLLRSKRTDVDTIGAEFQKAYPTLNSRTVENQRNRYELFGKYDKGVLTLIVETSKPDGVTVDTVAYADVGPVRCIIAYVPTQNP